jgi:hypothetical protein
MARLCVRLLTRLVLPHLSGAISSSLILKCLNSYTVWLRTQKCSFTLVRLGLELLRTTMVMLLTLLYTVKRYIILYVQTHLGYSNAYNIVCICSTGICILQNMLFIPCKQHMTMPQLFLNKKCTILLGTTPITTPH